MHLTLRVRKLSLAFARVKVQFFAHSLDQISMKAVFNSFICSSLKGRSVVKCFRIINFNVWHCNDYKLITIRYDFRSIKYVAVTEYSVKAKDYLLALSMQHRRRLLCEGVVNYWNRNWPFPGQLFLIFSFYITIDWWTNIDINLEGFELQISEHESNSSTHLLCQNHMARQWTQHGSYGN